MSQLVTRDLLPERAEIKYLTVSEMTKAIYGHGTVFDAALPQGFVDEMRDTYNYDVRGVVVMIYPENSVFGVYAPLYKDAWDILDKHNFLSLEHLTIKRREY